MASPLWPRCGAESGTWNVCRGREAEFGFLGNGKDYSGGFKTQCLKTLVAVQGVDGGWSVAGRVDWTHLLLLTPVLETCTPTPVIECLA